MAYDEEEARQSRVVVETPTARREVVNSQSVRTPDRSGISAGMVGVLVVVAIALITLLVLFWMSTQPTADQNANTVAQHRRRRQSAASSCATTAGDHSTTGPSYTAGPDHHSITFGWNS